MTLKVTCNRAVKPRFNGPCDLPDLTTAHHAFPQHVHWPSHGLGAESSELELTGRQGNSEGIVRVVTAGPKGRISHSIDQVGVGSGIQEETCARL